ncbi:MAG: (d)CMP kinase [Gammaproteobacteria bacterium]|nr:(d)CMP kinase [Gammaproteobacteria bacterium]
MSSNVPVITIDGLSASGKGTVANAISLKLGWNLLDSGLLYRIVAFLVDHFGMNLNDEEGIEHLVTQRVRIDYSDRGVQASLDELGRPLRDGVMILSDSLHRKTVQWKGDDVTNTVRGNEISRLAARVAASRRIRNVLVPKQREQRVMPGLVADGRDMGTVIFPDAQLKIFLEASPETRARRRMAQLGAAETEASFRHVLQSLQERDERDSLREVAPAKPAPDAVRIDSSELSVDDTVARVMDLARQRKMIV